MCREAHSEKTQEDYYREMATNKPSDPLDEAVEHAKPISNERSPGIFLLPLFTEVLGREQRVEKRARLGSTRTASPLAWPPVP